jgi:hypothetical protein
LVFDAAGALLVREKGEAGLVPGATGRMVGALVRAGAAAGATLGGALRA